MDTEKLRQKRVKPSRKHKPPYQQASSIVVPKSVISSLIQPYIGYFQSLFSIVALISINWFRVPSRHVRPLVACIRSHSPLHHHNYTTMPNPTSDLCRAWPRVADYPALSVDRAGGGNPLYAEDTPNQEFLIWCAPIQEFLNWCVTNQDQSL